MQILKNIINIILKKKWLLGLVVLILIGVSYFVVKNFTQAKSPSYQTASVEKGTLISSITASGQISGSSSVDITTQATGVVKDVFVKDGDAVTAGQKIADMTLDQASQQKQAAAWSSYLSAKNNLESAKVDLNTLQNQEFVANQKFINDAVARGLTTDDPTYVEENASWLAAEANYKNQQNVIDQVQAALNSSGLAYQQISPVITAPASGVVGGLVLTPGLPVVNNSSGSTGTSTQKLGEIDMQGPIQASVNLSEIDVVKVSPGQKVTLTLDAFPEKTFTGKVTSINTTGVVNSGVTNYPATISLDTAVNNIYPNMSVNASIITSVKDNVLLVPSAAVQTVNGQTMVRVLKNGQVQQVPVEVENSSDTQTEIKSGLAEGDQVVIGMMTTSTSQGGASPFGGGLRFGGGGGFGGGMRVGGGGRGG
ncbi:MAG: efflux RND transporter periplasmic adaptor subunit [Patescibacteria group bacterium]|nr:efflux RND transporter periplasmic adaptor subunit [Patescibacteria group bacterium]